MRVRAAAQNFIEHTERNRLPGESRDPEVKYEARYQMFIWAEILIRVVAGYEMFLGPGFRRDDVRI